MAVGERLLPNGELFMDYMKVHLENSKLKFHNASKDEENKQLKFHNSKLKFHNSKLNVLLSQNFSQSATQLYICPPSAPFQEQELQDIFKWARNQANSIPILKGNSLLSESKFRVPLATEKEEIHQEFITYVLMYYLSKKASQIKLEDNSFSSGLKHTNDKIDLLVVLKDHLVHTYDNLYSFIEIKRDLTTKLREVRSFLFFFNFLSFFFFFFFFFCQSFFQFHFTLGGDSGKGAVSRDDIPAI